MSVHTIAVVLTANTTNLRAGLTRAAGDVKTFGRQAESATAGVMSKTAMMRAGLLAAGLAVAAGLKAAASAAIEFDAAMRNVNSISRLSESRLAAVSDEVIKMSRALPQGATDLARGLYDIASSGFQGAEGLTVLRAAATAASAGLSTTATSAKAITAVLNAYGMGASAAADVSDVLFATVDKGVVSFDELATQLGDVVGMAAAAKVSIDDVGAAVAAMTLAGINAAESTTSLNRLIQSLIEPSEKLASLYQALGFSSGAAALEQEGLFVVMEKIRKATGGSVETYLELFGEIRAARGAFALAANEGQNYARTNAAIADEQNRAGAAARALAEQSKSLQFQLNLVRNRMNAFLILTGQKLSPVIAQTIRSFERLASAVGPHLQHVIAALGPSFRNLAQAGQNLGNILEDVARAAGPIAGVFAAIMATGAIAAFEMLTATLSGLTGILERASWLTSALGVGLTGLLIVKTVSAAFGLLIAALELVIARGMAATFTLGGLMSTMSTGRMALTGAFIAASVVIGKTIADLQKAEQSAKSFFSALVEDYDTSSIEGLAAATRKVNDEMQRVQKDASGGVGSFFNWHFGDAKEARARADEAERVSAELLRKQTNLRRNLDRVSEATGGVFSYSALAARAKKAGFDFTQSFDASKGPRREFIADLRRLSAMAGTPLDIGKNGFIDLERLEADAKAMEELEKRVRAAWDVDVIAGFNEALDEQKEATDKLAGAREKQAAAQKKLNELERRQAADKKRSVSDEQALEHAREDVAEATRDVADAQAGIVSKGDALRRFYRDQIEQQTNVVDGVTKLLERGLDPRFIQKLLEAGPAAAAPVIQAILADNTGTLEKMINESEEKLAEINTKVVVFARLTQKAIRAETDVLAHDLPIAMRIAASALASGAAATAEAIGRAIGVPTDEIRRIAKEFGITIAEEVGKGMSLGAGHWPSIIGSHVAAMMQAQSIGNSVANALIRQERGGVVRFYAAGGLSENHIAEVAKPGTIRVWNEPQTGGEAYVPRYGSRSRALSTLSQAAEWYDARIVAMAGGGIYGGRSYSQVGYSTKNQAVTNHYHYITNKTEFTGPIQGVRMEEVERYAAQRQRMAGLAGLGR